MAALEGLAAAAATTQWPSRQPVLATVAPTAANASAATTTFTTTEAPAPTTGAEALLQAAVQAGADVCFANPGTTEMWLVAALDRQWPAVRPVLCLHENVATGAADGYARISGRPALTLLHLGPGLANGIANLHNARRARSPVVNLVGDMATWHCANDPPLNSPLEALAATVSGTVVVAGSRTYTSNNEGGDGDGCAAGSRARKLAAALAAVFDKNKRTGAILAPCEQRSQTRADGDHFEPSTAAVPTATTEAVQPVGGSVVTVIVPHDLSWEPPPPLSPPPSSSPSAKPFGSQHGPESYDSMTSQSAPLPASQAPEPSASVSSAPAPAAAAEAACMAFVRDCAAVLMRARSDNGVVASGGDGGGDSADACGPSRARRHAAALYLGGAALLTSNGALQAAGQVAAATGAVLLCEGAFARVDRGAGLPALRRLPYFPQEAAAELGRYAVVVIVDAKPPVANFGYRGAPGLLLPQSSEPSPSGRHDGGGGDGGGGGSTCSQIIPEVWEFDPAALAAAGWDAAIALRNLVAALGPAAAAVRPLVNCGGVFAPPRRPPLPPPGRLTAAGLCAVVAALQPEGAVVVDESLTSGSAYWELSQGCLPFSHLTLTGGAIGSGPPLALGAAVALAAAEKRSGSSPSRRVINLQADGSAMYSLQALWSQARERLPVTTIICANSSYAILKVEAARQRLPSAGPATRALTDLSAPRLDWVALAAGMGVAGACVDSTEALAEKLESALKLPGPFLIQANL